MKKMLPMYEKGFSHGEEDNKKVELLAAAPL